MDNNNYNNFNQNMNQPQMNNNMNYGPQPMQPQNMGVNNGYNSTNNGMPPKKNNTMTIIIVIVAILLVAVGVCAIMQASSDVSDTVVEEKEKHEEEDKQDTTKLHEFSEYENYNFTMDITMGYMGYTLVTTSSGTADVKNSTDYIETTMTYEGQVSTSYAYDNYINGYTYTSSDKVKWEVSETEGTESIKLTEIITKINNKDTDVTELGNGHYSVKVDFESDGEVYNGVYADVYTSNGYITRLSYDLTSMFASQGYSEFTIAFKLSDFNEAGSVVIPDSVTGSATTSA